MALSPAQKAMLTDMTVNLSGDPAQKKAQLDAWRVLTDEQITPIINAYAKEKYAEAYKAISENKYDTTFYGTVLSADDKKVTLT